MQPHNLEIGDEVRVASGVYAITGIEKQKWGPLKYRLSNGCVYTDVEPIFLKGDLVEILSRTTNEHGELVGAADIGKKRKIFNVFSRIIFVRGHQYNPNQLRLVLRERKRKTDLLKFSVADGVAPEVYNSQYYVDPPPKKDPWIPDRETLRQNILATMPTKKVPSYVYNGRVFQSAELLRKYIYDTTGESMSTTHIERNAKV